MLPGSIFACIRQCGTPSNRLTRMPSTPISGCTMIGWIHSLTHGRSVRTRRPSTEKNRPLACTRFPVSGSKSQPERSANGIRSTAKLFARARALNQEWKSAMDMIASSATASADPFAAALAMSAT